MARPVWACLLAIAASTAPLSAEAQAAMGDSAVRSDTSLRARARHAVTMNPLGLLFGAVSAEYVRRLSPWYGIAVSGSYARTGLLTLDGDGCYLLPCNFVGDRTMGMDLKLRLYTDGRALRGDATALHLGIVAARNDGRPRNESHVASWRGIPTVAVSVERIVDGPRAREIGVFGFGLRYPLSGASRGPIVLLNLSYGLVF